MINLEQVVEAFEGITVTLGKDTVMLEGMTEYAFEFLANMKLHSPITIYLDKEAGQPVRLPFHLVPKL